MQYRNEAVAVSNALLKFDTAVKFVQKEYDARDAAGTNPVRGSSPETDLLIENAVLIKEMYLCINALGLTLRDLLDDMAAKGDS